MVSQDSLGNSPACNCTSWNLFHYGCRCGYLNQLNSKFIQNTWVKFNGIRMKEYFTPSHKENSYIIKLNVISIRYTLGRMPTTELYKIIMGEGESLDALEYYDYFCNQWNPNLDKRNYKQYKTIPEAKADLSQIIVRELMV